MPPEQDDPSARQIDALRRYVAELGTGGPQEPGNGQRQAPRRSWPSLPWVLLTAVLVVVALTGGIFVGTARSPDEQQGAAGTPGAAAPGVSAPVATPECKTAVDRANRSLAIAVKMRGALERNTKVMNDLLRGRIDTDEAARVGTPSFAVGSIESAKFDSALADYRDVVDHCKLRTP
jgi:hypothetical protein